MSGWMADFVSTAVPRSFRNALNVPKYGSLNLKDPLAGDDSDGLHTIDQSTLHSQSYGKSVEESIEEKTTPKRYYINNFFVYNT